MLKKVLKPFTTRCDKVKNILRSVLNVFDSFADKQIHIPQKVKIFKERFNGLNDFQKLILLTIAVCLPAGIIIATLVIGALKKQKK